MSAVQNIDNPALAALRYHVSGAVERGEAEAITETPAELFASGDPIDDLERWADDGGAIV